MLFIKHNTEKCCADDNWGNVLYSATLIEWVSESNALKCYFHFETIMQGQNRPVVQWVYVTEEKKTYILYSLQDQPMVVCILTNFSSNYRLLCCLLKINLD